MTTNCKSLDGCSKLTLIKDSRLAKVPICTLSQVFFWVGGDFTGKKAKESMCVLTVCQAVLDRSWAAHHASKAKEKRGLRKQDSAISQKGLKKMAVDLVP